MKLFQFALSIVFIITLSGCATGSYIATGNVRPSINPNEVILYTDPPENYETIGIVEAASEVEFSSQAAQNRAIQELKSQAAKIGANGVLISSTGNKSGDIVGFYSGGVFYADSSEIKTARGRAIFVIQD